MRHDAWVGTLSWWSCQSPVARSCSLLNHLNSFRRGMFKLNTKFDADSLLYLLSQFECDSRTVHMLTQWHLLSPLTSTGKSSLFTHVCSSPLSLAARLHGCHINHSYFINNGWTFSGQTLYMSVSILIIIYIYKFYIYIYKFLEAFTCLTVLKTLNASWKKMWLFPKDFFCLKHKLQKGCHYFAVNYTFLSGLLSFNQS